MEIKAEERCLRDRAKGDTGICLILCARDCRKRRMAEGKAAAMKDCSGFNVFAVPCPAGRDSAPVHPVPNCHEVKILLWWKILLLPFFFLAVLCSV